MRRCRRREVLGRELGEVTLEPDPAALSASCAEADRAAEAVAELTRSGVRIADFSLGHLAYSSRVRESVASHESEQLPEPHVFVSYLIRLRLETSCPSGVLPRVPEQPVHPPHHRPGSP